MGNFWTHSPSSIYSSPFMPNGAFSRHWRTPEPLEPWFFSLLPLLSYLSPSFLPLFLFPRLKWIMRSLITKTWQLSPRLSPSTRCNAPTSFPTSLTPDTPPTRCLRDVATERYRILPSLGLFERVKVPSQLHYRQLGHHSIGLQTLLTWNLQPTCKYQELSSKKKKNLALNKVLDVYFHHLMVSGSTPCRQD